MAMADNLRNPRNADSTSTSQGLGKGPGDMPKFGGGKPNAQVTSSMCQLSRTEHPVAQDGAHPGMGTVQASSSTAPLSRQATSPYGHINRTKPQVDLKK